MSEVTTLLPQADLGHRVPSDWILKEMRSLGEVKTGLTYKPEDVAKHGTLVLRSSNIQDERLVFEDNVFVSKKVGDGATVRKGDILICVRNGSRRLIGKSALITAEANGMAFGAFMSAFRSDLSPYLIWVFQSEIVQRQIEENMGATINQITNATLKALKVPMPPPHEQQAIAAALSDADGVVAGLERVIAKKRLIKQGAMQDLLTARRRLPGFSGEWEVKRLGDHVRFLKNGTHSRAQLSEHGPVKNLHYGDIHGAASIFLSPATKPMPTLDLLSAGRLDRLASGDLVFVDASEDLAGVGTSVEVTDLGETEVVSGLHTIAARFDKSILVDGFKAFLQFMPAFRIHLCQLAAGTKVLATNRRHVSSAEIALPRPDEQQAIAAVLSDMDAEIQTLESRLVKARAVKEGMMQNLLTGRVRLV